MDAGWAYLGCLTVPLLWIGSVFGAMQILFFGINWVVNGFAGRLFSMVYKRKAIRQAIFFVITPLVLGAFCMSVDSHFRPKGPFRLLPQEKEFNWDQFEEAK